MPAGASAQGLASALLDSRRTSRLVGGVGVWTGCIVTGLAVVTPILWTFRDSFSGGVRRALAAGDWSRIVENTIVLALESVVVAMVLGTGLAWCAHRLPRGRRWMSLIPIAPIFIPGVALATGWAFLLSPRVGYLNKIIRDVFPVFGSTGPFNVYSIPWIAALTGVSASGFVYLFIRSALSQLNQDVLDAAAASGASQRRVFFAVVLPLIRPALIYGAATTLLLGVGQVTMPLFLGRQVGIDVLSTAMYQHMSTSPVDFGAASAFGLPIVILGLVLIGLQRIAVGDQSKFVTVGSRNARPLAQTGRGGQGLLLLFGLATSVLPLLALIYVSLSHYWSANISLKGLTFSNYRTVFNDPQNFSAIKNTLWYTAVTVVVALVVSHVCARIVYNRRHRRVSPVVQDVVVSLPLGIPGVIFGLGFLLAYSNTPLINLRIYGTPASMIIVYVVLVLPFTVRIQLSAMAHMGTELSDAAAACGAGLWRRLVAVELPLLRPSLGYAGGLVVALIAQEFSASIMVRSGNTQVMSTALYDAWAFSSYPVTAAIALVMCVTTAVGVALCFALGGRSALEGRDHA
jgi:iron(III) transport system permease protein